MKKQNETELIEQNEGVTPADSSDLPAPTDTPEKKSPTVWKKASDLGKKMADGISDGFKAMSDKNKAKKLQKELEKYRPVFPEQFFDPAFHRPNMIVIVDDATYRNIEVCQGAIGCLETKGGMEILNLFDEFVTESKVEFVPSATCNTVYYVDNFDRNRFIRIDCIFSKAHEEKLAELGHIAFSLGAKRYSIEIVEAESEYKSAKKSINNESKIGNKSAQSGNDFSLQQSSTNQRSGKTVSSFKGNAEPKIPTLKWFAYDDNIKRLIEMRCEEAHSIKSHTMELSGSSSATMSAKTAYAIDAALSSMKNKTNITLEKQAIRENSCKLIFEVIF